MLMVALAFRRRAIPIAWTWQPGAKGHCSARVQLALLAAVRELLPPNVSVVTLVGDSEFEAVRTARTTGRVGLELCAATEAE